MKRCRERHSSHLKQSLVQNQFNKNRLRPLSGLVLMGLLATTAQAGKIISVPSASGAEGFGGWNENNIDVILNGINSFYLPADGAYFFSVDSDHTYIANVDDGAGTITGIALAKDWPVGEPPGIKIVNDDDLVKAPKPANCIMATSYLADHYLDSDDPQQVLCSGPFQSHKRYKLAMLPTGFDGIDLVFNVEEEAGSRTYQVFQKINNWTDGRLQGFTVQVGTGVGANFKTASAAGIALADLNISVPTEIWPEDAEVAVFSAGLFGPLDKHTGNVGFFDPEQRAGFIINEHVVGAPLTDTLTADTTLGSDYNEVPAGATNQFGPWIADNMLPYGVFFDDDGNPETDAALLAWYGYNPELNALGWMGGSEDDFAEVTAEEIETMGENLAFTMGEIDDLVNVGLDYVITIGDISTFNSSTVTIRVIPTADTSGTLLPPYVGEDGHPVTPVPELVFTSSDAAVLLDPNPEFVVDSLLTARVGDADLNMDPLVLEEVDVAISTDTGLSGTLTLIEQGENRGVFVASLPDEYSAVAIGTVVTMTYVDADNGTEVSETKTSSSTAVEAVLSADVTITEMDFPETITDRDREELEIEILNAGADAVSGSVVITGSDGSEFTGEFTDLDAGEDEDFEFKWRAKLDDRNVAETVNWFVTVTVDGQIVDEASATTVIEPGERGKKDDDDDDDDDDDGNGNGNGNGNDDHDDDD